MTAPAELRAECTQPGGDGIIIPKATVLRLFDLIDRLDAWIRTLDFDEIEDGCGPERSSAALIAEVDAWRRGETT